MPKNKNAYLRYRQIDQCLRNKYRYFNRQGLADRISENLGELVSIYTIDKDLKAMHNEFGAPIKFSREENRYYYSEPFSLEGFDLDYEEKTALNASIAILDILKDTKYASSFKSLIQRLTAEAKDYENSNIIEFEQIDNVPGIDLFDRLYEAISDKESLIIRYSAYGKESKEHVISPYLIKEYRNRFYLVAREHNYQAEPLIYCFGMDRIKSIKKSNEPFRATKEFNSKNYFKHSFGISRNFEDNPIDLELKFSAKNAPYVLSKPLHSSQKIISQTKDSLVVSIKVYESHELNMAILGYGAGVEVLSPLSYVHYIKGVAENMAKLYKKIDCK